MSSKMIVVLPVGFRPEAVVVVVAAIRSDRKPNITSFRSILYHGIGQSSEDIALIVQNDFHLLRFV